MLVSSFPKPRKLDQIFDSHTFRHADRRSRSLESSASQIRQTAGSTEIFLGFRKGGATSWRKPKRVRRMSPQVDLTAIGVHEVGSLRALRFSQKMLLFAAVSCCVWIFLSGMKPCVCSTYCFARDGSQCRRAGGLCLCIIHFALAIGVLYNRATSLCLCIAFFACMMCMCVRCLWCSGVVCDEWH